MKSNAGITSPTTINNAITRMNSLGIIEVIRRKSLYYRPVNPSPQLLDRLTALIQDKAVAPKEPCSETGNVTNSKLPENGDLQKLEESTLPENGSLKFQNLEETLPENGSLKFQKMEVNESKRNEPKRMDLRKPIMTADDTAETATNLDPAAFPANVSGVKLENYRQGDKTPLVVVRTAPEPAIERRCREDIAQASAIGQAFQSAFGVPPDMGRLMRMADQYRPEEDSWKIIKTIQRLSGRKLSGNPHDYLQAVITRDLQELKGQKERYEYAIRTGSSNQPSGNSYNLRPSAGAVRSAAEIRHEFATFRLPGS